MKEKFDIDNFNLLLGSCKCDKTRVLELYKFINSIKLNDIFSRGFTVDERLERTTIVSSIILESEPDNLLNLYDVVLLSMYETTLEVVLVFNSDITLPSSSDEFLGFLLKSSFSDVNYDSIDSRLKIKILPYRLYCQSLPYLERVVQIYDLMQDRIVHGTKTIMQKENSGFASRNNNGFISNVGNLFAKNQAESNAFLQNNAHSVLTIPPETNILFPTADVTQIDKAYMRSIDWLLAFFRIPTTKFFGETPSGFQSTGNLEILNYEQSLDEIFEARMKPILVHISNLLQVEREISSVSFYKLRQLDSINNVLSTTNSSKIAKYCDNMITAISGISDDELPSEEGENDITTGSDDNENIEEVLDEQ